MNQSIGLVTGGSPTGAPPPQTSRISSPVPKEVEDALPVDYLL